MYLHAKNANSYHQKLFKDRALSMSGVTLDPDRRDGKGCGRAAVQDDEGCDLLTTFYDLARRRNSCKANECEAPCLMWDTRRGEYSPFCGVGCAERYLERPVRYRGNHCHGVSSLGDQVSSLEDGDGEMNLGAAGDQGAVNEGTRAKVCAAEKCSKECTYADARGVLSPYCGRTCARNTLKREVSSAGHVKRKFPHTDAPTGIARAEAHATTPTAYLPDESNGKTGSPAAKATEGDEMESKSDEPHEPQGTSIDGNIPPPQSSDQMADAPHELRSASASPARELTVRVAVWAVVVMAFFPWTVKVRFDQAMARRARCGDPSWTRACSSESLSACA